MNKQLINVCDLISEIESIVIRYLLNKHLNKFNHKKEEEFRQDIYKNIERINISLFKVNTILGISLPVMNAIRESTNLRNSTETKVSRLESYIRQLYLIIDSVRRSTEEKQEIFNCIHNLGLLIGLLIYMGYLNQFRCFEKYEENIFKNLNSRRFEETFRIYRTSLSMLQPVIIKFLPEFNP